MITRILFAVLFVICSFTALAFAAAVPDPGMDPAGFFGVIVAVVAAKKWLALSCMAVIGGVFLLRKVSPKFATDRAGALLALLAGIATAICGVALDGAQLSAATLLDAIIAGFGIAVAGVGFRQWVKRLIWPKDLASDL